jgi:hypothetical protein
MLVACVDHDWQCVVHLFVVTPLALFPNLPVVLPAGQEET